MRSAINKQIRAVIFIAGSAVLAMQSTAAATAEASFWTTLSSTSVAVAGITAWKLLYYVFVALGICFYVYIIVNLILRRIPLQEKPGEQEEIKPSAYRNCPYCGVLIRSDAAGCDYCGIAFGEEPVYRCVRCKKIYPEKHDRCPACGAPVWQLDGIPMREKPKVKEEPAPVRGLPLPKVSVILGTTALYAVVIIAVSFFSTVYQLGTEDVRTLHERKPDYPGMRQLEQLAKETPPPVQGVPQEVGRTQKAAVNKGAVQQPPTRDRASQLLAELQASQFAQEPRIRAAIVELGDAAMPALQNALSSKESRMRQFAIPLLSGLHATQAVPALIQNVSHPDAAVRMSAIEALAKLGKTPAITALIKILGDSDVGVRRSAARALGELRAREAIPGLMMALNDSDSKVSELAWHSLQKISNQDLPQDNAVWITWWTIHQTQVDLSPRQRIATLRDKLQDSDPWVRAFAAEQLGHYKDPSTVSGLAALLSDDAPQVRRYAQRAMAEVTGVDFGTNDSQWVAWGIFCQGQQAQADMVLQRVQAVQREQDQRDVIASTVRLGELAIPALSSLVMKGNKSERFNAAVALSQIHRPAAIEPLQAALDDERELLRKTIIENLATFEDPAVKPLLLRALKDASPAVQERAATLLGKLHDYSAVPALLDRLQNTQVPVEERRVAARMLGNLADPSSAPALLQVLGKEPLLRSDIALALGNMRIREAVPELMRIVQSASEEKDYPLMAKTISALGMIGDASSLSLVMEALDTPNSEVHTAAIGAAGAIGGPGVATVLVKELNGIWWETAARTLGSIGSDKAVNALNHMLESKDPDRARVALDAFAESRDRSAVPVLLAYAKNAPAAAQVHAIRILGTMESPLSMPFLVGCLDDPSSRVATAAEQAIRSIGPSAIPVLIESLPHANDTVREQIVSLLGDLGDPMAVPALLGQLSSYGERVSRALTAIGPAAVPELIQALKNTDDALPRYHIVQALAAITAHDLGTDPEQWERWWKENARK